MAGTGQTRERRRAARTASPPVNVTLHDISSGRPSVLRGCVSNVSDRGMSIVISDKIQDRTYLTLRIEPWDWSGTATTRFCTQAGVKYVVGLELSPGTRKPVPLNKNESE
jgi:hypothetical protein